MGPTVRVSDFLRQISILRDPASEPAYGGFIDWGSKRAHARMDGGERGIGCT